MILAWASPFNYPHTNLGHVILAEFVKHSRPVLVVSVKHTPGSVKLCYLYQIT